MWTSASTNTTATTYSSARAERGVPHYFINVRGDEALGTTWSYLDITPFGRRRRGRTHRRATPRVRRTSSGTGTASYAAETSPDQKWVQLSDAGEANFHRLAYSGERITVLLECA